MVPAAPPLPLVSARWLAENLGSVLPVDVRWYLDGRVGRDVYESGHIPGAIHLDVDRDLASPRDPGRPGRHPLPTAEAFARTLQRAGVDESTTVVAYDDEGGAIAARLWWLLRYFGHPARVLVLDGGIQAWQAAGGAVEAGPVAARVGVALPTLSPDPTMVVDRAQVRAMSEGRRGLLLDARALPRYRGDVEPIDPRAGHVPGAKSAPFVGNLREPKGVFLSTDELRRRYEELGAVGADVVAYCGSGVTACHDLLALHLAGLPARLYEGSWSDWSGDPSLPAQTGSEP